MLYQLSYLATRGIEGLMSRCSRALVIVKRAYHHAAHNQVINSVDHSCYSLRRASIGSVRAARIAGSAVATIAMVPSSAPT